MIIYYLTKDLLLMNRLGWESKQYKTSFPIDLSSFQCPVLFVLLLNFTSPFCFSYLAISFLHLDLIPSHFDLLSLHTLHWPRPFGLHVPFLCRITWLVSSANEIIYFFNLDVHFLFSLEIVSIVMCECGRSKPLVLCYMVI